MLPLDRGMESCPPIELTPRPRRVLQSAVPHDAVLLASEWLSRAERPLIVLGAGCRGHEDALLSMLDAVAIPFVTTPRAKGIVSETHPRSLRNGGLAASMWARHTSIGCEV